MSHDLPTAPIAQLVAIMERLRDKDTGCPWDIEQTFATIAPHTIEEAYEVADAIDKGDMDHLQDELGDLLLQVVFHAQMAKEEAAFDLNDVASAINEKMIRRHPHIFGDASIADAEAQTRAWEDQKAKEREDKATAEGRVPSVLDDVTAALPALTRALKLQKRAARVGFDWPAAKDVLDKLDEELEEVKAEITDQPNKDRIEDELGDLLFVAVNLARKLDVDPEQALKRGNAKFERRFHHIETALNAQNRKPEDATLDEMEALWVEAKSLTKGPKP